MFGYVEQKQKQRTNWLPVPILGDEPVMVDGKLRRKTVIRGGIAIPIKSGRKQAELPEAYLQLTAKDTSGKIVSSQTAKPNKASSGSWENLQLVYQAKTDGTVEVSVVNASARVSALFDDLVLTQEPPLVVQENHYDPWGLNLAGIETQGQPDDKYQYLGQEKQSELGLNLLDFTFRQYDPQLGRFQAIDPLGGVIPGISPYQYGFNNPVLFSDPTGLMPEGGGGGKDPGQCIQCKDKLGNQYVYKPKNRTNGADNTSTASAYIPEYHDIMYRKQLDKPTPKNDGNSNASLLVPLAGSLTSETVTGTTISEIIAAGGVIIRTLITYGSVVGLMSLTKDTPDKREDDNYVMLYRNVGNNELSSYTRKGFDFGIQFDPVNKLASMDTKEFWTTPQGLDFWEKSDFAKPNTIVIMIPKSIVGPNRLVQLRVLEVGGHLAAIVQERNLNAFNKAKRHLFVYPNQHFKKP